MLSNAMCEKLVEIFKGEGKEHIKCFRKFIRRI